jgi:hypothetical protein
MQDTSCAVGFRKLVYTASGKEGNVHPDFRSKDTAMVCGVDADGMRMKYSTCCLPNNPDSTVLEVAVVVLLVTHIWAEVAQQIRMTRRVEYESLGQWFKEALSRYTHDIWNILDTLALLTATIAGVARACLYGGVGSLSPAVTADLHMYALVFGFLRIITVLHVFEFSGSQIILFEFSVSQIFDNVLYSTIIILV